MLLLVDEFAHAVDEARLRLSVQVGRTISIRELARMAGVAHSTLAYNLSDKRREHGRRVSKDLVRKLAAVLPISETDLMRAAQVAAGYQTRGDELPDLSYEVARFLDSDEVDDQAKRALTDRLAEILLGEMRKQRREQTNNG